MFSKICVGVFILSSVFFLQHFVMCSKSYAVFCLCSKQSNENFVLGPLVLPKSCSGEVWTTLGKQGSRAGSASSLYYSDVYAHKPLKKNLLVHPILDQLFTFKTCVHVGSLQKMLNFILLIFSFLAKYSFNRWDDKKRDQSFVQDWIEIFNTPIFDIKRRKLLSSLFASVNCQILPPVPVNMLFLWKRS